jgi:hypothetical protein
MTATAERTRLEILRAKEVELTAEKDAVRERLASYPAKIAAEREQAWYSKPSKRPLTQLNSPLQKLIDADAKDAKILAGLEADLSAMRSVIAEEDLRVREQETAEARAQLELLHDKEEAVYQRGGEALAALASVWNELVEILEEASQLAAANRLEAGILAVEPVPPTFKSWLNLLLVAATDPDVRAEPVVREETETGNFGGVYETRPVGLVTTEVRRRLDARDRLFHLIKPLGDVVLKPQLSGRIPTITSE